MAENLKCSICNKEATVHLTQIVNNKIDKVDLCESCAQKKGVTDPEGFSLADLLAKTTFTPELPEEIQICPDCGYKTADFRKTGRMGCATCYETFQALVHPVLEDMHAGTLHKGKVPSLAMKRQSSKMELKNLKDALARAVAEEAYEDAAKYRDQIKLIEEAAVLEVSEI
jgi:protein arginine kinase activator